MTEAVTREQLIRAIHDAPLHVVLAVTGGGSLAISDLLCVSGASRTVIEAVVPYAAEALTSFLGARPDQFCAEPTARGMAAAGLARAGALSPRLAPELLAGLGVTASLASDRPKRGAHRGHLAVHTPQGTRSRTLTLAKDRRSRAEEERLLSTAILNLLAEAAEVPLRLPLDLTPEDRWQTRDAMAPVAWRELVLGQRDRVAAGADPVKPFPPRLIFPGSFNPLHEGHRHMAACAERIMGVAVDYELSITNVDKPTLDYITLEDRVAQFTDRRMWLTRAATFLEKAQLFPGGTFIVGADTIRRIGQPHYYGDSLEATKQAIEQLRASGARFLVFGRVVGDEFLTLSDLCLPSRLTDLCQEVPEEIFREDVTSTALRLQARTSDD